MNAKAREMTKEELEQWNKEWDELLKNIEEVQKKGKELSKWQKK